MICPRKECRIRVARWTPLTVLVFSVFLGAAVSPAQQPPTRRTPPRRTPAHTPTAPAEQPKFKGIWEPVNYPEDVILTDVFFVNDRVGWVVGGANWNTGGFVLHTTDGGDHWALQLGDPKSADPVIRHLYFLDATHGWAIQGGKLIRTSDGETWEDAGNLPPYTQFQDYTFLSPTQGIALLAYPDGGLIYRTVDGGRTWKQVYQCAVKLEINGLATNSGCNLFNVRFASPNVGYAVGGNYPASGSYFVVLKTEDGGASWNVTYAVNGTERADGAFFTDVNTGFTSNGDHKLYATTDGGLTWRGLAASVNEEYRKVVFADPEVGWFCLRRGLTFTTDGGKHWTSRAFTFPADVLGFSLPRRDRAYVVGQHGMIYRYRVVPATYTAARAIEAPAMPGLDSIVPGEVAILNDVVAKLRDKLPAPAPGQPGAQTLSPSGGENPVPAGGQTPTPSGGQSGGFQQDTGAPSSGGAGAVPNPTAGAQPAGAGGFQQDAGTGPVTGGYLDSCCGPLMQQLETTANSFATNVPAFSQRFRNLNLIFEGLNFLNRIVNQANTLKQSIRALRQAKNAQAAAAALNTVSTQVNGISSSGGFVQDTSQPPQH